MCLSSDVGPSERRPVMESCPKTMCSLQGGSDHARPVSATARLHLHQNRHSGSHSIVVFQFEHTIRRSGPCFKDQHAGSVGTCSPTLASFPGHNCSKNACRCYLHEPRLPFHVAPHWSANRRAVTNRPQMRCFLLQLQETGCLACLQRGIGPMAYPRRISAAVRAGRDRTSALSCQTTQLADFAALLKVGGDDATRTSPLTPRVFAGCALDATHTFADQFLLVDLCLDVNPDAEKSTSPGRSSEDSTGERRGGWQSVSQSESRGRNIRPRFSPSRLAIPRTSSLGSHPPGGSPFVQRSGGGWLRRRPLRLPNF